MDLQPDLSITEWTQKHVDWPKLAALVAEMEQQNWVAFAAAWHQSSHLLVAQRQAEVVGFLRYVVQEIGVEEDLPAVTLRGQPLTEGKVIAFGVAPAWRRQGIGRQLQLRLIADCRARGCYQIRSHSSAENRANHALKLALGFALHPLPVGQKKDGAYFLLPLRAPGEERPRSTQ